MSLTSGASAQRGRSAPLLDQDGWLAYARSLRLAAVSAAAGLAACLAFLLAA